MRQQLNRTVVIFVLCVLVLSITGAGAEAQTWWFGKNKVQYNDFQWSILKTPHFDVHFNEGYRDLAARTAIILEYGYNKISRDFSHNIKWRIPVILYGSHSDFQQTNVTWSLIPEGVQAFAEPMRKRIVLHFSGSNTDFTHTTIHELVHIFQFDIIYGSLLKSVFSRNMLFQIPLWFAEGGAEYYSIGYDLEAEMFMRDATVFDYLPDLDLAYGYMNYKAGQAAIFYLNEKYGPEKVVEIMNHLRHQRSMELALRSAIGVSTQELSREWKKYMRRRYWPLFADKKEPEYYGRKLTDHMKDHHYMNTKPVFSPDGEYIVYFSDRKGLDAIYLMNALTGKVEKKLLQGSMSTRFESIRTMRSSLTFNPDGTRIVFVAKSHGRDKLFIMEVPKGKVVEEIALSLDFFHSPSWSPDGKSLAIVGTLNGQTDLYLLEIGTFRLRRVTNDIEEERNPSWFPDGSKIVYSRYPGTTVQPAFGHDSLGVERLAGVDFGSRDNVLSGDGDIWQADPVTGDAELLIRTSGNDRDPIVIADGNEIIFISDEDGIPNLYRGSLAVKSYYRFTDVLGGIFSPSYSNAKDRIVFSAFNSAGYDLFILEGFSSRSAVSYSTGSPYMDQELSRKDTGAKNVRKVDLAEKAAPCDTVRKWTGEELDSLLVSSQGPILDEEEGETVKLEGSFKAIGRGGLPRDPVRRSGFGDGTKEPPEVVIDEDSEEDIHPDSLKSLREEMKKRVGTVEPYSVKFSPDYIGNGMGVFFATGFGFGLMNQVAFSDLLGDHRFFLSFNIFRSLEDSDMMFSYYYLRKRIDYAVGVFQFKNYLSSRVSSVGENFIDYRFFTERNYGIFGLASFPFSTFTRFDLEFQGFVSEREFFDVVDPADKDVYVSDFVPGEKSQRRLFQPSFSLVHDSAYFGSFGPVIGSRWIMSVSRSISFSGSDVSRTTALVDYRRYFPLFYRNYFAFRGLGAISRGDDSRFFYLGGPLTMRGYDFLQFSGSRMLLFNLEYRYPLVDAIIFGWPGRWGIRNIGGTVFLDTGSVWGGGRYIEELPAGIKPSVVNDLAFYSDFGVGFYMRFGFLILNFQLGWPTDFSRTGEPFFHFYLGPQF